ncbi:SIR2 family protein [uncultured Streptococcus sp.]|uniref:SIR2 family protein n=1 Tax=uncultured Streptococcus sp. TaxID=83427 RepID=UPI0028801525|nr:SIR2 family protein [uncultured Streptococcus sp.]
MEIKVKWPKLLLRSIAYNNLAVLFGAGIPNEFGFPLWGTLIDELNEEFKVEFNSEQEEELNNYISNNDYLEAMEFLNSIDQEKVIDYMCRKFNKESYDSSILDNSNELLLLKLDAHAYLTTNIDNSLEFTKSKAGKKSSIIYCYNKEDDIKDKLVFHDNENDPLIIRLHGELGEKKSFIFSSKQYSDLMNSNSYIFEKILPALLLTSTTIIVGYSLSDPDIQLLFEKLYAVKGVWKNMFFLNTNKNMSNYQKNRMQEKYGIKVVDLNFDTTGHSEILKDSLKELLQIKEKIKGYSAVDKKELFNKSDNQIIEALKK